MKKIFTIIFVLTLTGSTYGQTVISSSSAGGMRSFSSEAKLNFLNLIALGSLEMGYEKYLSDDHSLDLQLHINDRFGYNSQGGSKNYKTNAVQAAMNFYFGNDLDGRFYLFPLAKLRFGEFEEEVDGGIATTDMNAFMIGLGMGYKWELSQNFAFGPHISIARGFSNEVASRFTRLELNSGFSLGFRF